MLITCRNRFRLVAGIRQISFDAVLPIILLPIFLGIAAMSYFWMITVCILMPLCLGYAQCLRKSFAPKTKFFLMWSICSAFYLWLLFESFVPLLELLPEENFIFITTMFGAILCFYKVWYMSHCIHTPSFLITYVHLFNKDETMGSRQFRCTGHGWCGPCQRYGSNTFTGGRWRRRRWKWCEGRQNRRKLINGSILIFAHKFINLFRYFNRVFRNQIPMITAYREQITFVRNVADIFHRVLTTAKRVNNASQNVTIIAFGWIVVSVNRIINCFCWAVSWPCLLCYLVLTYQ